MGGYDHYDADINFLYFYIALGQESNCRFTLYNLLLLGYSLNVEPHSNSIHLCQSSLFSCGSTCVLFLQYQQ